MRVSSAYHGLKSEPRYLSTWHCALTARLYLVTGSRIADPQSLTSVHFLPERQLLVVSTIQATFIGYKIENDQPITVSQKANGWIPASININSC